jgi:hypothetical protein
MLTDKLLKVAAKYNCEYCQYNTSKTSSYTKHLTTAKHIRKRELTDKLPGVDVDDMHWKCNLCEKKYKSRVGLWKHKHMCVNSADMNMKEHTTDIPTTQPCHLQSIDMSVVIELLKQNQEFKDLMVEQSKQILEQQQQNNLLMEQQNNNNHKLLEAVKDGKIGNTIHNNNTTNNNKFNLNFFLNETCKDAITMSDFINSIEVTLEDFIQTGNIGFVDGISKVMVERIKVMDLHTRPMHCTDLKRETLYIKNDTKWEKEDSDKTLLRKAVKNIANKNYNKLSTWYNNSKPAVEIIGSEDCENYFKYYKAALGGYDKEEDKKFEEKIIKNVLKEVLLDKTV